MQRGIVETAVFILISLAAVAGAEERAVEPVVAEDPQEAEIVQAVSADRQKRTAASGTLDLYDEKANKVRNLRLVSQEEPVKKPDNTYAVVLHCRDIASGDLVDVESVVLPTETGFTVKALQMTWVEPLAPAAVAGGEKKEFSDEEILAAMKDYLAQQTRFTESLLLFDEENNKMRSLTLVELKPEVRHLGIYASTRAVFQDIGSGEVVAVDITVVRKEEGLAVDALRIREVRPAAVKEEEIK